MTRNDDEKFMKHAVELALKGWGTTSPNPLVGAVVVKGGRIVGEGYHRRAGLPHAEVNALRRAGRRAKDATLYVTLEPCCHQGRTPPCVDRIVEAGVREVVMGTLDPNPVVNGRGVRALRRAGVRVRTGVLRDACREINRPYEMSVVEGRPFVILKAAVSLDGKIATPEGESRWITGKECRSFVHRLRSGVDAIVVGRGTIIADDPSLTVRVPGKRARSKIVVVLDETLDLPQDAKIFTRAPGELILATTSAAPSERMAWAKEKGYDVIVCPRDKHNRVSLHYLLAELNKRRIVTALIEGGGETFGDFMLQRLVDHVVICIAPKIIGGEGKDVFPRLSIPRIEDALQLTDVTLRTFGDDVVVEGRLA